MIRRLAAVLLLVPGFSLLAQEPVDPFAKWDKEVSAVAKKNADAPTGGVVFAGSSSIRLWDLKKSFPNESYVNCGFGGSKIADCTHFVPKLILPLKPTTIVFYAGDNDIGGNRTPEQVRDDFLAYVAAVHAELPKCRVLFVSIKPSLKRWEKMDSIRKANELVKAATAKDERLGFVDIVPPMLGSDEKPIPELFQKDGLHLTPKGYELWAAAVGKSLGK